MDANLNRRAMLGALGATGLAAAAAPAPARAAGPPPHAHGPGVRGTMTGARAAVAALQCVGTACVFGVPGAQNNEFWDAMKSGGLPYLLVTNEASSSVMADAAARATGTVGVFAVVPGPGLTNALTGIGEALLDSIPVIGIVTDVDRRPGAPIGQVHSLNNAAILRPVCKAVLEVRHQAEIPAAIFKAHQIATCGEPGPVGIILPFTFLGLSWDYDFPVPPPPARVFDEAAYQRSVALLSDRRVRVGIYAGLGCVDAGPSLAAAAEMLQAPVATSVSGKGSIADGHPLAVGWGYGAQGTKAAEKAFRDVDLVLAVGVKFSEVSTANYSLPPKPLIHVDANPQNLNRNLPANVAVAADARTFLDRLLADSAKVARPPCPPLKKQIRVARERDRRDAAVVRVSDGVDPMVFLVHLRQALGPEELIFVDVTASTHWASEAIEVPGPRRYFTPANNQSMGWSIPAAIGAQRVRPDRMVVSVSGDGCFLMSAIECSTAARAGLPVKFFVLDDGAYHYMQMLQTPQFRRTTATEIARVDHAAFAASMGLAFNRIPHNGEIAPGIARALATPGPVLTSVCIGYEGREIRWVSALKASYIRRLDSDQKVRMVGRIALRSLDRDPDND